MGLRRSAGRLRVRRPLAVVVTFIAAATLLPGTRPMVSPFWCVLCGDTGVSDAIRNVLLFAPFGAVLVCQGVSQCAVVLIGAAFSGTIEGTQLFIFGRDANLGDVLMNTTGTLVGAALVTTRHRWLVPARGASATLSLIAAFAVSASVLASGWLMEESLPRSRYFGQWTPALGHLERYGGTVLSAEVGDVSTPSRAIDASDAVRAGLIAGAAVRVRAVAGPPVPALASLFSIADDRQRTIFLIGPDRNDLVIQIRRRAAAFRLEHGDLQWHGALAKIRTGDTLDIVVQGRDGARCVSLNGRTKCDLGFSPGVGWTFIHNLATLPASGQHAMNMVWMLCLVLPFGFWARAGWRSVAGGTVLLLSVTGLPLVVGLHPAHFSEWIGAGIGILAGYGMRLFITGDRSHARHDQV